MQLLANHQVSTESAGGPGATRIPEARYSYYCRCQVFRRNGQQCKAPAEKGSLICHAHAGQQATAFRRELERRIVLAQAVAEMRRRGQPECQMADLFTDFKGIQVTLAVMSQALIGGRIDCKTAGQLVVHLQTMSKLLWMIHRKGREGTQRERTVTTKDTKEHDGRKILPLINTDNTDPKKLKARNNAAANQLKETRKTSPLINSDDTDGKQSSGERDWPVMSFVIGANILQFAVTPFGERSRAHGPPELKAA